MKFSTFEERWRELAAYCQMKESDEMYEGSRRLFFSGAHTAFVFFQDAQKLPQAEVDTVVRKLVEELLQFEQTVFAMNPEKSR